MLIRKNRQLMLTNTTFRLRSLLKLVAAIELKVENNAHQCEKVSREMIRSASRS